MSEALDERDLAGVARIVAAERDTAGAAVQTMTSRITSTQVMERALTHFPGAVVVVSHDRFFVDKLADRRLMFGGSPRVREAAATGAL